MASLASSVLNSAVSQITVKTTVLPDIPIDQPFAPSSTTTPTGAPWLMTFLKPELVLTDSAGNDTPYAPYGDPGDTLWPYIAVGLGAVGVFLIWRMIEPRRR